MTNVVAVPLGLGLKALGHDPLALDFRQEEFKFARKFDRLKWVLTMALGLSLFLFVFLLIHELLEGRAIADRQIQVADTARSLAHKHYFPLLKDKEHAQILDATDKNPDEIEKRLESVPPDRAVADVARLVLESGKVLERKYGYKPGEGTPGQDVAISALARLNQWLSCFKALPELTGRFMINNLMVTSSDITWNMDLADEKDWDTLNAKFKAIPGIDKPERPTVKIIPAGAGPPGMGYRYDGCKLLWPREGK